MKTKTLMAMAALALLVALPARAADPTVVSANTVGYQRLTIPANGYALLANPFVQVGTGTTDDPVGYAINDMFNDDVGKSTAGNTPGLGDQMQIWDTIRQGYTTYFFSARAGNKWASSSTPREAASKTFEFGDGFWYLNRGDEGFLLTTSGEVSTNEVEVTLAAHGYTLVCNPFPADLPLNSVDIDWVAAKATAGNTPGLGDQIQLWDIERQGYTTYFFSARAGNKWASSSTPREATTKAIPAGQGFWYLNRGDDDVVINLKSPLVSSGN